MSVSIKSIYSLRFKVAQLSIESLSKEKKKGKKPLDWVPTLAHANNIISGNNSIYFRHFWLHAIGQVQSLICMVYLNSSYRYHLKITWEWMCTCGQNFSFTFSTPCPVLPSSVFVNFGSCRCIQLTEHQCL